MAEIRPDEEPELLRRFRSGDDEAFHALLASCEPELSRRAARWMDDAVQRRVSLRDPESDEWGGGLVP